MTEIAILTPDPADDSFVDLWPGVLDRVQRALSGGGMTAIPTPWTAHVDDASGLARFPLVLPLLVWGYHLVPEQWRRACRTWQAAGIPLANPAEVLAWNADKRYLERFAQLGVAVPPTTWTERVTAGLLEEVFATTGAEQLIVKPTMSAGGWRTRRVRRDDQPDDVLPASPVGSAMIQPYLPTIETAGETSLLFFGGRLSHAVNKRPVAGEFRIQVQYGGIYTLLEAPPDGALALARQTLDAIDAPLLYARIDTVPDANGRWLLMEAELIEPDFYLGLDPRQGAAFGNAVSELIEVCAAGR